MQTHFLELYSSKQPQCKLGYDSSPQCDSFQLGEMVRFFTRKGTLHMQSTFGIVHDPLPYTGRLSELLATLRQLPPYQIDHNHVHCGPRSRLLPALDCIRPHLQTAICLRCWKQNRSEESWLEHPMGGEWHLRMPSMRRPFAECRDHRSHHAMYTAETRDWTPPAC